MYRLYIQHHNNSVCLSFVWISEQVAIIIYYKPTNIALLYVYCWLRLALRLLELGE
jgi:hypothetical protein